MWFSSLSDEFCKIVFGKVIDCQKELEYAGKKIARSWRGLPLSIVVIGGLLTRSHLTRTYWEYILENLSSYINLEKDEYCLQILSSSYKELPVYLKPCFLYMGVFPEDGVIHVPTLVNLWVSEGILKPTLDKRLEEIGEEYIKKLINRNLILVYELRWNGKARLCKIHDLLRDLCLREAQKQRFLCVLKHRRDLKIPQCLDMERRICIHDNTGEQYSPQFLHALKSASLARSLILMSNWQGILSSLIFRLLRVYTDADEYSYLGSVAAIFQNANLRCIDIDLNLDGFSRIPSSWFPLWNLQTLKLDRPFSSSPLTAPPEIWEMPLLRHVMIRYLQLPDPRLWGSDDLVMEDLQTLACISDFKCTKAMIRRIPNLKKLRLKYQLYPGYMEYLDICFQNFVHLKELQSLSLQIFDTATLCGVMFQCCLVQNLNFPRSLKKLTLGGTMLNWEECAKKIGSLPLLQFLSLDRDAFLGSEWETVEGQFRSLKFLRIYNCNCLKYWRTDSTHFPHLEHLVLQYISKLEEIPSSIGDIPTLESIELENCSISVADSAKRIKEEQAELGNIDLQVHIGFIMTELLQ